MQNKVAYGPGNLWCNLGLFLIRKNWKNRGVLFLEHWTYEETDDGAQYQGSDGVHLP